MKKKLYNEMIEIISQHSIPKKCAWECAWEDEMKHFHEWKQPAGRDAFWCQKTSEYMPERDCSILDFNSF